MPGYSTFELLDKWPLHILNTLHNNIVMYTNRNVTVWVPDRLLTRRAAPHANVGRTRMPRSTSWPASFHCPLLWSLLTAHRTVLWPVVENLQSSQCWDWWRVFWNCRTSWKTVSWLNVHVKLLPTPLSPMINKENCYSIQLGVLRLK